MAGKSDLNPMGDFYDDESMPIGQLAVRNKEEQGD